jgi:hypothetical protein
LDTYHPDTLYLREQGCVDPWLFLEAKRGTASKKLWETLALRLKNFPKLESHSHSYGYVWQIEGLAEKDLSLYLIHGHY